jgi:hypothetical protein
LPYWKEFERTLRSIRANRSLKRIYNEGYGHRLSIFKGEPVDAGGNPVPWFTYPALEYLSQLDLSQKRVFEFGTGGSTSYWCLRAAEVRGVEHNTAWYTRVKTRLPANGAIRLAEDLSDYVAAIGNEGGGFDIIVVDGVERRRCCIAALAALRPGGMIILDNSDWHHICARLLREGGLLEVDMSGLGPINVYTWTTSFFFSRDFDFPSATKRRPMHGVGALQHLEEE